MYVWIFKLPGLILKNYNNEVHSSSCYDKELQKHFFCLRFCRVIVTLRCLPLLYIYLDIFKFLKRMEMRSATKRAELWEEEKLLGESFGHSALQMLLHV